MEHVRAQVEHSPLVDLVVFVLRGRLLAVPLDKERDLVRKLTLVLADVRVVLLQVREANQQVHQVGCLNLGVLVN